MDATPSGLPRKSTDLRGGINKRRVRIVVSSSRHGVRLSRVVLREV